MRRITRISVTNLFGMFNHTIPLNLDERITIIHGPNGFGKTIILTILNDVFSERNSTLLSIPFDEFRVDFDDHSSLWVSKAHTNGLKRKGSEQAHPKITFHASIEGISQEPYQLKTLPVSTRSAIERTLSISRLLPEDMDMIDLGRWRHSSTGEILSLEDVMERFGDRLPNAILHTLSESKEPDWLKEIRSSIPIGFIQTQRLLNTTLPRRQTPGYERQPIMVPTVKKYSDDLVNYIKSTLAESVALSQSLDRTFPKRAVDPTFRHELTEDVLRIRLKELENKRERLIKAGLLDQDDSDSQIYRDIDERTAFVLSVYVEDTEQKLGVFDKIVNQIDLLTSIINKRFSYKQLAISKEEGFVITAINGTPLPPEKLSSGEQHELVLLYELLFKVESGSLILIDEPELSLHVGWQLEFLRDLQEVSRLAGLDVLVATHSPQIINDRWDLTVQLEGPRK